MAIVETFSEPTLNLIPRENIDGVVPLISEHLRSVCERSRGLIDFEATIKSWRDGALQLWIVWNGSLMAVGATELTTRATGLKVCTILFLTGEHSLDWLHTLEDLEAWAKQEGCDRVVGYMRKGWAKRLPDYRMSHVYLEKDLS